MFKSMTGFAHRDFERDGLSGSIQLKSYNNRYLDISIALPPLAAAFEPRIQKLLAERLGRGKVEFGLRLKKASAPTSVVPDIEAAKALYEAATRIAKGCGLAERPSLEFLARFEGVLSFEKDIDAEGLWEPISPEIAAALDEFEATRAREGAATEANIAAELERFERGLGTVRAGASEIDATIARQLKTRFDEILPQGYDEQRMLQELAVQLVRLTINEEVSRLDAHIAAFKDISREDAPAKKLDFLCQEMNREVNTIGSKNTLVPVAHAVVEMKDALENIREQLRNIE
ncbi:YicC family protein [bacterium]|nr:YicC family protein [bacterium]